MEKIISNLNQEKSNDKENYQDQEDQNIEKSLNNNKTLTLKEEQKKRHRRCKNGSDTRDFKCPECQKCYLSFSALKNHRKVKHDFEKDAEKKGRGRPKKEFLENDTFNIMKEKFDKFFEDKERKKTNNDKINISLIKNIFKDLYIKYKNELFNEINDIEKYIFYEFIINNIEKENPNLENKSYFSMINCSKADSIVEKPSIDEVFFIYIKYLYNKINENYFSFVIKYIIIFREYINKEKNECINKQFITENKKNYTQIYDGEIIPDLINDFLMDFMVTNNYFGLDKDKIIELIEYFCFWLYLKGYTNSHISKIE